MTVKYVTKSSKYLGLFKTKVWYMGIFPLRISSDHTD